ncbi:hypothetical protein SCUP234_03166 [Seiridium cupressi]
MLYDPTVNLTALKMLWLWLRLKLGIFSHWLSTESNQQQPCAFERALNRSQTLDLGRVGIHPIAKPLETALVLTDILTYQPDGNGGLAAFSWLHQDVDLIIPLLPQLGHAVSDDAIRTMGGLESHEYLIARPFFPFSADPEALDFLMVRRKPGLDGRDHIRVLGHHWG